MTILVHKLETPISYNYQYGDSCSIDNYDIERIEKLNIDEIWYWYEQGSYEGSGQMLMRRGDQFDLHDMGHCSCYGPTDNATFKPQTLKELKDSCSEELLSHTLELFNAAEEAIKPKPFKKPSTLRQIIFFSK